MNRNCYQLVFNATLGMVVPQAETARRRSKSPGSVTLAGVALAASSLLAASVHAAPPLLPVAGAGGTAPGFVSYGNASYQTNGNVGTISQVGNKSILNWQSFNVGAGNTVKFQQVDALGSNNLVQGAAFTSLNRIWDANPSMISGAITQGAGQQANVILVNNNGIAFMNGAQVNLNSFTATSLNMADRFVTGNFLGTNEAQFDGTLDFSGSAQTNSGFVKVMEGAQITAGSQGRVMLLAPTVVNRGSVSAADGQVILGAGSKAYLRVADNTDLHLRGLLIEVESPSQAGGANSLVPAALAQSAEDVLGLASNSGTLSTPRGNITMVGYAVNQNGVAKATTSVVANGSVYLVASALPLPVAGNVSHPGDPSSTGQVILGSHSVTSILPEVGDSTTSVDSLGNSGLDQRSEVRVVGHDIYMAGGAQLLTPSGKVDFLALDDASKLTPVLGAIVNSSGTARIDMAAGAVIDVSGLNDVQVSVARNTVEVQLRGDELKDSPINQAGPLRGQTVYVDIAQAQATPNSLIAADSLLAYAAKTTRTVAERSTAAGSVNLQSANQTILENGARIDLSGGSLAYQSAVVQRSLVGSSGKFVDVSNALATTHYDSLPTRLVVDYGRWNHQEVYSSGPTSRFVQGYTEGKAAGSLRVMSLGAAYLQADILGRTTVGKNQRQSGTTPKGATLSVGNAASGSIGDYKGIQQVLIKDGSSTLGTGFAMGSALSSAQDQTLELNSQLLGLGRVANLQVYTNSSLLSAAELNAPEKGEVTLVANALTVQKNISAAGGNITLSARNTAPITPSSDTDTNNPSLVIGDKVALRVGGTWVNDKLAGTAAVAAPVLNAGSINLNAAANGDSSNGGFLTAGTIRFGQGVSLDASAGAYVASNGKISNGQAGVLDIYAYGVSGLPTSLQAYGASQGGTLKLTANKIQLGGTAAAGTLGLDSNFLQRGGFASYALNGMTALDVAPGTALLAQQSNRVVQSSDSVVPTGTAMADVGQVLLRDDTARKAVTVTLSAQQSDPGTGALTIGQGASMATEAGGTINLNALNTLDVQGTLVAHGGSINLLLDHGTGSTGNSPNANALWLGSSAVLDASGVAVTHVDSKGLTQGSVYNGGTVSLKATKGYVTALAGSRISVAGVAPVRLDVKNESGGIGRMVGSDAGSVQVFAEEALVLESTLQAQGGSASNRSGNLSIGLSANGRNVGGQVGYDTYARELHLANSVPHQAGGQTATQVNPQVSNAVVTRSTLGMDGLEAGGFDTISISSRDGLVLEGNLDIGSQRAQPLRELKLDAARIETDGGHVTLTADALRLGNYDTKNRVGTAGSSQNAGTLTAQSRLLELAGNLRLQGMASSRMAATEQLQLSAVSRIKLDAAGTSTGSYENSATIASTGNLTLQAGVVTPSSYGTVALQAAGKTIRFEALGAAPLQPLSALGRLQVDAENIEQAGRLWAPLGQIALNASKRVTLAPGSITSVAADAASVLPLGQIQNGLKWVVNVEPGAVTEGQLALTNLPQKSVSVSAASVDMQSGSSVNLAGGGKLQAYEFTVGPGGSRDILSDANIYAVVPSFKGGFAPSDPQEALNLRVGSTIYLNGMPGLTAGSYTLLPAHYALLPGAFAVRLDTAASILPGQEYTRQDGVRIASGYLSDSRSGAPRDANWKGFEVLTGAQIHARSELTVTQAADFFASGNSRPVDAGQLRIATTGTGASSLLLNGNFVTAAATGGRGAAVDISADKLVITNGAPSDSSSTATVLQVDTLNAMGARSLLIGGTRSVDADTTTLQVGARQTTLDNASGHALQAPEVILAATDTVTLKSGSSIVADASAAATATATTAASDGATLRTAGMGALVRVASSNSAFVRTGNPGSSQGTLVSEVSNGVGSTLVAASAITLDATQENSFKGSTRFTKAGQAVAGNLAVGASRVNFGAAGNASGVTYAQADLDALSGLASMAFTSYSTFDLYGDVQVGALGADHRPSLNSITLQGAGLVGRGAAGNVATINAKSVLLTNPGDLTFSNSGASGSGQLAIVSDTLTLGAGSKTLDGFAGGVAIASGQVLGQGTGSLHAAVPLALNTARLGGAAGSEQTLALDSGSLVLNALTPASALAASTELGAKWTLRGDSVAINTAVDLHGGSFTAQATAGDVSLGANGRVDVSGQTVAFFDQQRAAPAGRVQLSSSHGNVALAAGAQVDVSAAAGGDAGTLVLSASQGTLQLATGNLRGNSSATAAAVGAEGARVQVDAGTLASFSDFNSALGNGFAGQRQLRVRSGNIHVAATDVVRAKNVDLSTDSGQLSVAGTIDASRAEQGSIALHAGSDLGLAATATLRASSSTAGKAGGSITMGSTNGRIRTDTGSRMDVHGGSGGVGGQVLLRAARTDASTDSGVKVDALNGSISGASAVVVEAVQTYANVAALNGTLTSTAWNQGPTLTLGNIKYDNTAFATHSNAIATALFSNLATQLDPSLLHVRAGVEVQSSDTLNVGANGADLNLVSLRTDAPSASLVEAGTLTLRAANGLSVNSNVSDGFTTALSTSTVLAASNAASKNAWSYRFVAGADLAAANAMTTQSAATSTADLTLAAGKLIRTGAGSIALAAAQDVTLSSSGSVVYTAGQMTSTVLANFVAPIASQRASFTQNGGDLSLQAGRSVNMAASTQLYSEWLFREGRIGPDGVSYYIAPVSGTTVVPASPAWWVRFDQFNQGVATLGGGNLSITAGADLVNVGASTATQGRMNSLTPSSPNLVKTGGGNLRLEAGGNVQGGAFYADNGSLVLKAGGKVGEGRNSLVTGAVYPVLALGDASASVQAQGDINILAVVNPTLLPQSYGSASTFNVQTGTSGAVRRSAFSTYGDTAGVTLTSVSGNTILHNTAGSDGTASMVNAYGTDLSSAEHAAKPEWGPAAYTYLLSYMPPQLEMVALQGDVKLHNSASGGVATLAPSASGQLNLLAKGNVVLNASLTMSDRDPLLMPAAATPFDPSGTLIVMTNVTQQHAAAPVHAADTQAAHVYAVTGDVAGVSDVVPRVDATILDVSKAVQVRAGRDVLDFNASIQNANASSVSVVQAGRDIAYSAGANRTEPDGIKVSGPGRLEVSAGRNLDLGTSGGIRSLGNQENTGLPNQGADIQLAAGVGAQGIDYTAAISRLLAKLQAGAVDSSTLWQARWLVGDNSLSALQATSAVASIASQSAEVQRQKVRDMVYTALRTTGRDYNSSASGFGGDYARGYAALDLLFPGIATKAADGSFANYQGNVNLFASRVKSESGGNIEFMVPGGEVLVGLANTPEALVGSSKAPLTNVLGMVVLSTGDIRGFSRGDMVVNQSRILTVGGGDVLLWSSEGGIDAGKGKKTASAVPPPLLVTNYETGTTKLVLQGAATGSGIGALALAGITPGDVDLIAPKGTVNAGDAGIRAGNLNVAALDFKGADNVSVSGKSVGTPVADTSAVTAAASGASSMGDDASKTIAAASQNASDAARAAQALATALKPTIVRVDVLGFGE